MYNQKQNGNSSDQASPAAGFCNLVEIDQTMRGQCKNLHSVPVIKGS